MTLNLIYSVDYPLYLFNNYPPDYLEPKEVAPEGVECPECKGSGHLYPTRHTTRKCDLCDGAGWTSEAVSEAYKKYINEET